MKKKLLFVLTHIEEIIAGICLTIMVGITFCNVIGRYFFTRPITWGDELAMMLAAWVVFLGMSAAYKHNQHLGMEFFLNRLSQSKRLGMERILCAVMATLCTVMAIVSWQFVMMTNKRTAIMRVPYKFVYAAAAVGFTFMTIYSFIYLYQSFFKKDVFKERYISEEEEGTEL